MNPSKINSFDYCGNSGIPFLKQEISFWEKIVKLKKEPIKAPLSTLTK